MVKNRWTAGWRFNLYSSNTSGVLKLPYPVDKLTVVGLKNRKILLWIYLHNCTNNVHGWASTKLTYSQVCTSIILQSVTLIITFACGLNNREGKNSLMKSILSNNNITDLTWWKASCTYLMLKLLSSENWPLKTYKKLKQMCVHHLRNFQNSTMLSTNPWTKYETSHSTSRKCFQSLNISGPSDSQ